jgi:hypothetical protein
MLTPGNGARPDVREGGVMPGIDGAGIDKVLQGAVEAGAVPHVAAIAANRPVRATRSARTRCSGSCR